VLDEFLSALIFIDQVLEYRSHMLIRKSSDDHAAVDDHCRCRADSSGVTVRCLCVFCPRVDDGLNDVLSDRIVEGLFHSESSCQFLTPFGVSRVVKIGEDLVMDLEEPSRIVSGNIRQLTGPRMKILIHDSIALPIKRIKLENDVDLPCEFFFQFVKLLCEKHAVRAEKVCILDDLDGSILEILCGLDSPVRGDKTRIPDHGKLAELIDDPQRHGSLRIFSHLMILNHPVGSDCSNAKRCHKNLQRRPEIPFQKVVLASSDPKSPEENKTQNSEHVESGAQEAQASQDEQRVDDKRDDSHKIEKSDKSVGPFEALGWENRTKSDKHADDQAKIPDWNPHYLSDSRKS